MMQPFYLAALTANLSCKRSVSTIAHVGEIRLPVNALVVICPIFFQSGTGEF